LSENEKNTVRPICTSCIVTLNYTNTFALSVLRVETYEVSLTFVIVDKLIAIRILCWSQFYGKNGNISNNR